VVTSLASFPGRRRATGVIAVPSLIRLVARAAAVSSTQGSAISLRAPLSSTTWSHTNNPSHPASSARRATSANTLGSTNSPKFGTLIRYRMSAS
jgi:hypothetical protein